MNDVELEKDRPEEIALIGDALLEEGKVQEAVACYEKALKIKPGFLYAHNQIEKFGSHTWGSRFGFNCQIHPEDDIYRFIAQHPTSINPIRDYLSDGWRTMLELINILDDIKKPLPNCKRFLEFACGFGRFTRHLEVAIRKYGNKLVVSDVAPGSIEFLKENFGVEGFYSKLNPDDVDIPGYFDVIFVLSLFTHLPEDKWGSWLRKMYGALNQGGVLIFTTHGDKAAKQQNICIPDTGFLYCFQSESSTISINDYGTTFTSAEYVKNLVLHETGQAIYREYLSHFWFAQDAYVVMRPRSFWNRFINAWHN